MFLGQGVDSGSGLLRMFLGQGVDLGSGLINHGLLFVYIDRSLPFDL